MLIEGKTDILSGKQFDKGDDVIHEGIDVILEQIDGLGVIDFQCLVKFLEKFVVSSENGVKSHLIFKLQSSFQNFIPCYLGQFLHTIVDVLSINLID